MAQQNEKQPKAKTGLARCLELASGHKGLVFLSGFLAALAAICSFVPYLSIYYIIREILFVYPDMSLLNVSTISTWGWLALVGILGNIVFYFFALLCSHIAAFGTLYELKVAFADHIMHIPLGYHLTLGSGKLRKIMDENIESVEKFIAHQLPDFVASLVAPLVLVIILLGIDWRYGVVCLVGIVLAFIVQFAGFNGEAKEKMHRFQTAQENMNSASVEYVRGMPEIKAFNQTADSFKRLSKSITDYTSFVLEYALGWQNCMPAFTTIINNIYLFLISVGVLIGMHTTDFREYSLTFIFYLIIVHAISGILNKIMYISESFTQIDGSVERMDEILRIPVLPEKNTSADIQNYDIAFQDVSFSYEADSQVMALTHISFLAPQGKVTAVVGPSGGGKSTIANLISRFYDVTDGSIQIGGVDIRDIPLDALMDKVSFVFQDTFLFKQSILDNIRMGNPDATEEQVIAAAKAARCHDFIEQLPNGYQTVIGSTGVHLSGGERQRIAIARAKGYENHEEYMERSLAVVDKMEALVKELLYVSKADGKQKAEYKLVDFAELVRVQIAGVTDLLSQKEQCLEVDIPDKLLCELEPAQMERAIQNILVNAIRYSPSGELIRVSLAKENDTVYCEIENTGVHIPENTISHLFEAFYRADTSRNRNTGGTGLGLYIVRKIMELHQAKYGIKNSSRGVLFWLEMSSKRSADNSI